MNNNHTRVALWVSSSFIAISVGVIIYSYFSTKDVEEKKEKTDTDRFIRQNSFYMQVLASIVLLWSIMSVVLLTHLSRRGLLMMDILLTFIMCIASVVVFITQLNTIISRRNNKQIVKEAGLCLGFSVVIYFLSVGYYLYFIEPAMRHMKLMKK